MGILNERNVYMWDQKGGYKLVENPPAKFRDEAAKLSDIIEKVAGKRAGEGVSGGFTLGFGNRKTSAEIRKADIQKAYSFTLPKGIRIELGIVTPDKWVKFAEDVWKAMGYTKGNTFVNKKDGTGKVLTTYYYKKLDKNTVASGYYLAPSTYGFLRTTLQFYIQCIELSDAYKEDIMESASTYPEFQDALERQQDAAELPGGEGFEEPDLETVFGKRDDEIGFNHSITFADDWEADSFFPRAKEKLNEMMDLTDRDTRQAVLAMDEADASTVLHSLANRLYDNIVKKVDDIDYGDIPGTKGDITKLPNYEQIVECNNLMRDILKEYHQDTKPVDVIYASLQYIVSRREIFERAYRYKSELPIITYENIVLAIIASTSYLIATSIEFIKTPNSDGFNVAFNKMSHVKTRDYMLYGSLERFNASVISGDFDKAMEWILQNRIKKVTEAAATGVFGVGVVLAGVTLVLSIIPILREIVFFFFYMRTRISDFFDIQADLLQMNAYNIQQNTDAATVEEKEVVVAKQLKVVDTFRKISNFFAIKGKEAEVKATREITAENTKAKIGDVTDSLPDGAASALF